MIKSSLKISDDQRKALDRRKNDHTSGKAVLIGWEEVKKIARIEIKK